MDKKNVTMMMTFVFWIGYNATRVSAVSLNADCDALESKRMECHAQQFLKYAKKGKMDNIEKKLEEFSADEDSGNKNFILSYSEKLGIFKGFTALLWAARSNDTVMTQLLVKEGSSINPPGSSGYTPLYFMTEHGNLEVVQMLIEKGAHVNIALKDNGYTPVLVAAEKGFTLIIKSLLENGGNPNVSSKKGATPILLAAQNGHTIVVKLLLESGANANSKSEIRGNTFGSTVHDEGTELESAIGTVERTTDSGLHDTSGSDGFFPLYFAAKRGNVDMVSLLLDKNADVSYQTLYGETALITATAWNRGSTVIKLLDASADPNVADKLNTTALHRAAYYGYTDILQKLVEKGADINARNFEGRTPLHFCAKGAKTRTLEELLKSCPDDEIRDINGKTALDLAISERERLMMKTKKITRTINMIAGFETFIPLLKGYTSKACS